MGSYSEKLKELKRKTRDRDVKIKLNLFLLALRLGNVREACERRGYSRTFFYKWWNRLVKSKFDLKSLCEKSRRPKRSPKKIAKNLEEKILFIRKRGFGSRMIKGFLEKQTFKVAHSTINHVLNNREKSQKKKKRRLKVHRKRYELPIPGLRLQLDVKYVPSFIGGERAYNYVVVDECTRWRFAWAYKALNEHSTLDFLTRLKAKCPFPIFCIQTDNGFEFTFRLNPHNTKTHLMELWCEKNKITHRCIPPGEKELNGKVERSHRIDMEYFYWRVTKESLEDFNMAQEKWLYFYNFERIHGGLKYITPIEKLNERIKNLKKEEVEGKYQFMKLRFLKARPKIRKWLRRQEIFPNYMKLAA